MATQTVQTARRCGAILPLTAVLLVVLLAVVALAVDLSYIALAKTHLQNAADASALAAGYSLGSGRQLTDQQNSRTHAKNCAKLNPVGSKPCLLADTDVTFGRWDDAKRTFTVQLTEINAIRVVARRDASNAQGPLPLFFAPVLGIGSSSLSAEAIVVLKEAGAGTRFLIDDEMFDTDVPTIEAVAKNAKVSPDTVLGDGDKDWFIDLWKYVPAGQTIELPTGQVGDEALFDVLANEGTTRAKFPFTPTSKPSLKDFLNYNEDSSSWRYSLIPTSKLDPLPGVGRWNQPSRYASLVNKDAVLVSPVFRSDVSALDGVGEPTRNGVNALGLRRGLVAFKIVGVGRDPDGSGSVLPNLIIELVDPRTIQLDAVVLANPTSSVSGVRLVK